MPRRPAAHNPMIFRKVARPPGHVCTLCGCYVLAGKACDGCAFAAALAADELAAASAEAYHSGHDPADTGYDLNNPADRALFGLGPL